MRKYIAFIQSVSNKDWEVGEIICNEIKHNPQYEEWCSEVFYAKTFQELENLLMLISNNIRETLILIQIDAHSNSEGFAFKDVNNPNKDECSDYVEWTKFNDVLAYLYDTQGTNITLIFVSCCSSLFAESLQSPHVPIIAAEGTVSPRRAEEQLIKLYEGICMGASLKEAFELMTKEYPIEDERSRDKDSRSILKLYM